VLHFVGRGSTGPQKLDRQNRTLATPTGAAWRRTCSRFSRRAGTFTGQVELAGEAYRSDQPDRRADDRFIWVFPLRKKLPGIDALGGPPEAANHLPYGAYAVIDSDLSVNQVELVNEALDRLKEAGNTVFDKRDVDRRRYDKALTDWWERVLVQARPIVNERIAGLR
jgi:hypothetical protein